MKRYIGLAALALLVMGCEKEDSYQVEEGAMHIEVLHPSATRATETAFESGDKIGIYATEYSGDVAAPLQISGNWANNVATTFDGASWTPAKKVFWSENKMDVYGYYPYMIPTSIDEHLWSVQLDQSTPETADALSGYEASDFLWGKATGVSQTDGNVQLEFKHKCTKMVIKLVKGEAFTDEFPKDTEVYLHSTVPTATIDFTTGNVSKDIYGERQKIKTRQVSIDTYEVILIPQSITERMPFIEVTMGGISYLTEDKFSYLPGVQYSVSITLNSSPEQIEVEIGGNIENWE
ncbi:MAG: fimbrillin family protein [Alistipes sp.]|nr:fimbrillin family protein [Bacteroidales bacterium]MBO7264152.1 fimbrillin family protein [Alistipes sp.]